MIKYIVLWIPRTSKSEIKILRNSLEEEILRDIPNTQGIVVKAAIQDNYDIILSYRDEEARDFVNLTLHRVSTDTRGYLQYQYEISDELDDYISLGLKNDFHKAFYHYLKDFFHEHLHHGDDEDSLLKPLISDNEVNFDSVADRKKIARNYLESYITKFDASASDTYRTTFDVVDLISAKEDINKNINFLGVRVRQNRLIFNEIPYARFLNDTHKNDGIKDETQRLEIAINSFDREDANLQFWYNHYLNISEFKIGRVGLIVGVISLVFTLCLECFHSFDHSVSNGINHIDSSMKSQEANIKSMQEQQVIIDKNINATVDSIHLLRQEMDDIKRKLEVRGK